jgi:hypothetical protein
MLTCHVPFCRVGSCNQLLHCAAPCTCALKQPPTQSGASTTRSAVGGRGSEMVNDWSLMPSRPEQDGKHGATRLCHTMVVAYSGNNVLIERR